MRALLLLLACTVALGAAADQVVMRNGDVLSGTVTRIDAQTVQLESPYAGSLALPRAEVERVETDAPLFVEDASGEVAPVRIGEAGLALESVAAAAPDAETLQPPPAPAPAEEAPRAWEAAFESGATLRSGQTDTFDATAALTASWTREPYKLSLRLRAAYGEVDDVLNTRRYFGEVRADRSFSERFYVYALTAAEQDDSRRLDLRLNAGVGLGYTIIDSEVRTWRFEAGLDVAREEYAAFTPAERDAERAARRAAAIAQLRTLLTSMPTLDDADVLLTAAADIRDPLRGERGREEDLLNLRVATHYEQQLFTSATLTNSLVVFPSLDQTGEFRAVNEFALTNPLSERLELRLSLLSEYSTLADQGDGEPWDNTLTTGLRYTF